MVITTLSSIQSQIRPYNEVFANNIWYVHFTNDVEIMTYYIEVQTVLFKTNGLGLVINYGIQL